jgi:hypothetical protein
MVLIKVQWDAYNRQFRLIDRELAPALEDGETYMLIADVSVGDLESKMEINSELSVSPHNASVSLAAAR